MDNFLIFSLYIYCYPSLELSQQDGSNEGSQHTFSLGKKKNYLFIILVTLLTWSPDT